MTPDLIKDGLLALAETGLDWDRDGDRKLLRRRLRTHLPHVEDPTHRERLWLLVWDAYKRYQGFPRRLNPDDVLTPGQLEELELEERTDEYIQEVCSDRLFTALEDALLAATRRAALGEVA